MALFKLLRPPRADPVRRCRVDRAGGVRVPEHQGHRARVRSRPPILLPAPHRGPPFRQDLPGPGAGPTDEDASRSLGGGAGYSPRARCDLLQRAVLPLFRGGPGAAAIRPVAPAHRDVYSRRNGDGDFLRDGVPPRVSILPAVQAALLSRSPPMVDLRGGAGPWTRLVPAVRGRKPANLRRADHVRVRVLHAFGAWHPLGGLGKPVQGPPPFDPFGELGLGDGHRLPSELHLRGHSPLDRGGLHSRASPQAVRVLPRDGALDRRRCPGRAGLRGRRALQLRAL
jgi:hypothetical protein